VDALVAYDFHGIHHRLLCCAVDDFHGLRHSLYDLPSGIHADCCYGELKLRNLVGYVYNSYLDDYLLSLAALRALLYPWVPSSKTGCLIVRIYLYKLCNVSRCPGSSFPECCSQPIRHCLKRHGEPIRLRTVSNVWFRLSVTYGIIPRVIVTQHTSLIIF
jgi:hypothetical protein